MALVATVAAGLLFRRLSEHTGQPAGQSLQWIVGVMCVGAVCHLLAISPIGTAVVDSSIVETSAVGLPTVLGYDILSVTALLWTLFAVQYTGRERLLTRPVYGALVAVPLLTVALSIASLSLGGVSRLVRVLSIFVLYLSGTLLMIGAAVVVRPSLGRGSLPLGQGIGFASAIVVLYLGQRAASFFQRPTLFPLALLIATTAVGFVLWRYDPFRTLPVAGIVSRDRIIEEMSEAVFVLDTDDRIRDLNGAAVDTFDCSRSAVVGRPIERVAPPLATTETAFRAKTDDDRWLSVSATDVTDERGRRFGRLLVCRDVTERRTRESRLRLLTRVLADTIHDRMRAVAADAGALAADQPAAGDDSAVDPPSARRQTAADIRATATDLAALVAEAREAERALANGDDRVSLERIVETAAADAAGEDDTSLSVTTAADLPTVRVDGHYLRITFAALCENALDRAASEVTVRLSADAGRVTIRVRDDGPPPGDGPESAGSHGVWLATAVVETLDGDLVIEKNPDGGRDVVVSFPEEADSPRPAAPERDRS